MSEVLLWGGLVVLFILTWTCGYYTGKANGIREVRYLLDEQWRDYEEFRDLVFMEMGIEMES